MVSATLKRVSPSLTPRTVTVHVATSLGADRARTPNSTFDPVRVGAVTPVAERNATSSSRVQAITMSLSAAVPWFVTVMVMVEVEVPPMRTRSGESTTSSRTAGTPRNSVFAEAVTGSAPAIASLTTRSPAGSRRCSSR